MSTLYLIPARAGSKGLPGKNIKLLHGKPLLYYSIDFARIFSADSHICVSTDSDQIIKAAKDYGLDVPFKRPTELASDLAGSREVILHALNYFGNLGRNYKTVILLQPTSPFRNQRHIREMINIFDDSIDMVVSVKESRENPYFSLFEEVSGFLTLSKKSSFLRRQDSPKVYAYNGSVYIINSKSLHNENLNEFDKVKKYIMDDVHSLDIDTNYDWLIAEMIVEKGLWLNP